MDTYRSSDANLTVLTRAAYADAPAIVGVGPPRITADHVSTVLAGGTRLLDDVSLEVRPNEVVAIIGPSGSGKTTLLDTLAGLRAPTSGSVRVDDADAELTVAYVPQDDIVHRDLTVEATVRYSARLRLPDGTPATEIEAVVTRTLATLGLAERSHLPVGSLSGGQRKRVSIASEIVTRPHVCFLDEPTAGLDVVAAAALMDVLRDLADHGTAVVMTTHNLGDLRVADRLVVLLAGGRVAFDGAPHEAPGHFDVDDVLDVCRLLAASGGAVRDELDGAGPTPVGRPGAGARPAVGPGRRSPVRRASSPVTQWRILARRNVDLMIRNRMSFAIMAGSPVLIVAMFAVLFEPGAFDLGSPNPMASTAISYWMAFAAFFFGLTFGLLQICTELAIVRRERLATIDVGPYLLAKAAVLVPVLGGVNVVMVATLIALRRLPALGATDLALLLGILLLDALAGLALGLLASASVASSAQAALALPMLCFPAVLFSGAIVPMRSMAPVGRAIGAVISDRWAFEAVARTLHLDEVLAGSAAGRHVAAEHGRAFSGSSLTQALVMAVLTGVLLCSAHAVLARRTRLS
ncbi:MAG: ABC transporter ATP-binding protein [Acidimicrobiia bacterium]